MTSERPLSEKSASSAARALFRKSVNLGKRPSASNLVTKRISTQLETVQNFATNQANGGLVSDPSGHVTNLTNGNESDEGESTAEEIAQSVESSNAENILDPIDFIESNPRLADPGNMHHTVGKTQYENWGMFTDKELEELARKNKISMKRSKTTRGGKIDRQRPPHPLPRVAKVKPIRVNVQSRKRRLSGRLNRPPQLSLASEEGDMAQADEMGEGEGRDDGFVDCPEAIRKRNRKKTGGVHSLFTNGSPQSSPSNTPVSRRRASSRKARPKPRVKKPSKLAQHASADISTQESTTQGPGSSDSSEEGVSPQEGASLRLNEEPSDSDSDEVYEDARSLTPHSPKDPPTEQTVELDCVEDVNSHSPLRGTSGQSNSHDSNETSDTDFRSNPSENRWKFRRFESDLSTAPFSSETSDMDTSGNERILKSNGSVVNSTKPSSQIEHRQLNSESSGDEVKRSRDVKIIPRPPPKPIGLSKPPPPAKKPANPSKSSPLAGKINNTVATQTKAGTTPARNRGSVKGPIPTKPKPPVAAKPNKPELKPRPSLANTQARSGISGQGRQSSDMPNGRVKPILSPPSLRKIQSEQNMKKPLVAARPHRVSEPLKQRTDIPAKPSVSPRPRVDRLKHAETMPETATQSTTSLQGTEDPKTTSSSDYSPPVQAHSSPVVRRKPVPQSSITTSSQKQSIESSTSTSQKQPATEHLAIDSESSCSQKQPPIEASSIQKQQPIEASGSPKLPSIESESSTSRQNPLEHSSSSPVLQTKPPQKPARDVEKRETMRTRAQPTPDMSSTVCKDRSQSDPAVLSNGVRSPSPPPVPKRLRESTSKSVDQLDIDRAEAPVPKSRRTPSPITRRSPPHPPREATPPITKIPEEQGKPSKEENTSSVPSHNNNKSDAPIYTTSLSMSQITTIKDRYEVCDLKPTKSIEEYYAENVTYKEMKIRSYEAGSGDRNAPQQRAKKRLSTTRRAPPKPPVDTISKEPELQATVVKTPQPEASIPDSNQPSPIILQTLSLVKEPPKSDPPKRPVRPRRTYEMIDILEDRPGAANSEKSSNLSSTSAKNSESSERIADKAKEQVPKPRPVRRDYEEIDIIDNVPHMESRRDSEPPVSPITMVAVTRQTSAATLKFNSTTIPQLPVEDLRENFEAPDLPVLPPMRRQAKSFSAKRGKSMICKRSVSERFMKMNTLDPTIVGKNGLHRTPSLDDLNQRMDSSLRKSMSRISSSDDEETTILSPTQQIGLPKTPSGDTLYSSPKPSSRGKDPEERATEPLYQYINTAEFLRENPAEFLRESPGPDQERANGYSESRGKHNQLEVARHLSQKRLWCEQPEVISSGVLSILSDEERKLQEAIFEVITSEATYLRSLDVLINHFMEDPGMNPHLPEGRRVLDKRQHHVIFSNVREVREISARFLDELQRRQRESAVVRNISDIILNYADNHFGCYVSYCTNQVYQTREMQTLLESSVMFREYLKRLEKDKKCQNLNMQSFLLLPMQRITRLPLLVLAILNRTPLDHPDHHIVERTLRTVQKLVTSCNDGARKMERTEQLLEIHTKLEFGKLKPFPLVSASRQLERKGNLIELQVEKFLGKIKVKKTSLYLFVFTDYVIIAKKKKDPKEDYTYKVIDHASRALVEVEWIETHVGVNFEKSTFSKAESVARATWAVSQAGEKHAFLLVLLANAYGACAKYLFLAQNDTDKTRWMESMERQDVEREEEKIYQMWDCPQVQAIFDYNSQQPDELDLQRGDVVKVYRKMADGWYEGERLRDLRRGWFPSNFCVEIENEHTRARNLRETHRLRDLTDSLQSRLNSRS